MRTVFVTSLTFVLLSVLACKDDNGPPVNQTQFGSTESGSESETGGEGIVPEPDGSSIGGKDVVESTGGEEGSETADEETGDGEDAETEETGADVPSPTDATTGEESGETGAETSADAEDATSETGAPDIPFEDPDTGCTPDCEGKTCGDNGCGSICGFCVYGNACNAEGSCIPVCDPVTPCQGKTCGPDGCGGECGDCSPSFACGEDGLCYESACEPQCDEKVCGPDLCGGVCGTCKGLKLCDTDVGECVSNPCGAVGFKGACADANTVVQCLEGALVYTDCTETDPEFGCAWNAFNQGYECAKPPDCVPDCSDKQCGDGGCNYGCGDCFNGWSCINFQCAPEPGGACGTVPSNGLCIGNSVYFCNVNGKVSVQDCTEVGKQCGYESFLGEFSCL